MQAAVQGLYVQRCCILALEQGGGLILNGLDGLEQAEGGTQALAEELAEMGPTHAQACLPRKVSLDLAEQQRMIGCSQAVLYQLSSPRMDLLEAWSSRGFPLQE